MADNREAAKKKWKMAKFRPTMDFGKVRVFFEGGCLHRDPKNTYRSTEYYYIYWYIPNIKEMFGI